MPAVRDKAQFTKFYYGNAMEDLKDFLPADEAPLKTASFDNFHAKADNDPSPIEASLQSIEHTLDEIKTARRELSYLVQDLNRMIKK